MDKDKTIRKGIIASIIATVIFMLVLEPIMKILWKFLNTTSSNIYSSYLDSLFVNAALGHRNHIDFMTLTFEIAFFSMFLYFVLLKIYFFLREEKDEAELIMKSEEELLEKLNKSKSKLTQLIKKLRLLFISTLIASILFFMVSISTIFKEYANIQLNTTFNQRLIIIAPFIDDHQIKMFNSKWALMKSKNDYLEIKQQIDKIAKDNKITLPNELIIY